MEFYINEIIENEEVKRLLRTDPEGLKEKGKALAETFIKTGTCENPGDGLLPLFVSAFVADHTLEINTKRGISRLVGKL